MKQFIGKEVQIYPSDTYSKFGIVESVDEFGVVIKITRSEQKKTYPVGKKVYFSHSKPLSLLEV